MPDRVLLVCPDPMGLASMAGALSPSFPVLSAKNPEDAMELIARHGPCGAAFCEGFDDPESGAAFAARLAQVSPGIAVIALARPPCPESIRRAAASGVINGICLLPLAPESLREKARQALAALPRRPALSDAGSGILTRAEVDFLLGRELAEQPTAFRRNH